MVISRLSSTSSPSILIFLSVLSTALVSSVQAWGTDGHHIICNVAEKIKLGMYTKACSERTKRGRAIDGYPMLQMLNPIALAAVEELLPDVEDGHLSQLCSWADDVRDTKGYEWSKPLHYIDTPDKLCNYNPIRDCRDAAGTPNYCASGAITNYTNQLTIGTDKYNLTEALLFLSHIVGDIHQPLHVGFEGDKRGNSIEVYWYNTSTNLHHVWDANLLFADEDQFFAGNVTTLTKSIHENITSIWSKEAAQWNKCAGDETACPDLYASESIKAACEWAYRGASSGTSLRDSTLHPEVADRYFLSRLPVLQKRLAQAAVRLAGILNRVFPEENLS